MKLRNLEETALFARKLGNELEAGDVILLVGDLGAGKTTLTKGIAKALGIEDMIKSPTYTIVREYLDGRIPLYHMDVYRVTEGIEELGLEEYFEGDGISVVEWGNLLDVETPENYLQITLKRTEVEEERELTLLPVGSRFTQLVEKLEK
ncbi:MAG: tRNA (adenosine(37)-N6)-threonylcarbamoyltransferase complex ATPase subunit type 1 TsaE [Streptococcaceae bacterium]|nr:tRNA (adenosine(37)-N6)-threonylcarbamoyltransferase complex ATPase subunit type 1 TsaE [Streptococcaceae bacterium]